MKASWIKASALVVGVVIGSVSFSAYAQKNVEVSALEVDVSASQYVMQSNEIAAKLAPVKAIDDLKACIARTPVDSSPLNYLSPAAKSRFLSSLQFNEKGVSSFSYADLEAEMTPSQIYEVLSLFGIQRTVSFMKRARVMNDTDRLIMGMPNAPLGQCNGGNMPGLPLPGCDHDGYRCVGHGSCAQSMSMICTSNC
ncbi:hypothetical protein EO087_09075 [Dyella sp. M7H15-1]|uniref:hypothetical protein n=1 Tax=Dyella sp. M7H15-1 TaxID=2501295 RepID=UPI001004F914|nr:hypothetical protein [Dyella sp. M7H15-1]QAU24123.1 hypothetical protein EO087_09075 [Dyella sp. M7H15-1]